MELVEELEAAAAPSPSDALVELAWLRTATRLKQLTYECDTGRVIVSEYVALKNQRDDAADVCRICHGPCTVRPAEADDETGARLLRGAARDHARRADCVRMARGAAAAAARVLGAQRDA